MKDFLKWYKETIQSPNEIDDDAYDYICATYYCG